MPGHPEFTASFDAGLKGAALPFGTTAIAPDEVEQRFAVYRNNVAVSLTEALSKRFPVIQRLVGDAFFAAMARVYAEDHRPRSPVLLEWGDNFPDFLAAFPPLAAYPYMADVARIEFARGVAYHAADEAPAPADQLMGRDPSTLHLRLHGSVQVLRLAHPAVAIWELNQPGTMPQRTGQTGPQIALILRNRAFDVLVHAIGQGDAEMIDRIMAGNSLLGAAEAAAEIEPGHDPQSLLVGLIQAGVVLFSQETQI